MKSRHSFLLPFLLLPLLAWSAPIDVPQPAGYADVHVYGELKNRLKLNFDRLEESKYQPSHLFLSMQESGGWPGDTEGRTILALVEDARSTRRQPRYLKEIIRQLPAHLNASGYMGPVIERQLNEQQLSGNGWMMRGLAAYADWQKELQQIAPQYYDAEGVQIALRTLKSTVRSLYLPNLDLYGRYPVSLGKRPKNAGGASGTTVTTQNGWQLSTDIGCVFIGLDGLVDAYRVLHEQAPADGLTAAESKDVCQVIETLISKFEAMDLLAVKAQTHASLTAMRALIRYAELTGKTRYIALARKRYDLYLHNGMTENYENYNWFGRLDSWTEPCAIVDSYLLALKLWQHTLDGRYLSLAERIYYNGLCHTQRRNGGFGLDNCPGLASHTPLLQVHMPEAHWCCTMRGAEGLSEASRSLVFQRHNEIWLTAIRESEMTIRLEGGAFKFGVSTSYPYVASTRVDISSNDAGLVTLHLPVPQWVKSFKLMVNEKVINAKAENGFVTVKRKFETNDRVAIIYYYDVSEEPAINPRNTARGARRYFFGPFQLGCKTDSPVEMPQNPRWRREGALHWYVDGTQLDLTPVYHEMNQHIWAPGSGKQQILF